MNGKQETGPSKEDRKWRKVNVWSTKGPLLLIAVLLGAFSETLHWRRAPFVAGVAVIIPVIGFRDFWKNARFWVTVFVLVAAQVPLVVYLNPFIEQYGLLWMLAFGIADCLLVASALSFICSLIQRHNT